MKRDESREKVEKRWLELNSWREMDTEEKS